MFDRKTYTKDRRNRSLEKLSLVVECLGPTLKPNIDVTKSLRQKVQDLDDYVKVFEAAHVKYVTELITDEDDKDLIEEASKEFFEAKEKADKLLYPSDPELEEVMASIERQKKMI